MADGAVHDVPLNVTKSPTLSTATQKSTDGQLMPVIAVVSTDCGVCPSTTTYPLSSPKTHMDEEAQETALGVPCSAWTPVGPLQDDVIAVDTELSLTTTDAVALVVPVAVSLKVYETVFVVRFSGSSIESEYADLVQEVLNGRPPSVGVADSVHDLPAPMVAVKVTRPPNCDVEFVEAEKCVIVVFV